MRKQLFAAMLFFICCGQASAQLEKGNLHPKISFESRFKQSYRHYGIRPEISYALDNHSAIGISYNYYRSNKYIPFTGTDTKSYGTQSGFGITYNYFRYFKGSKKLGWYVNANLDFNKVNVYNVKPTGDEELNNRYNESELSIRPGLFYKPSKNLTLFANIGGFSIINTEGSITAPPSFGSQVNVGVLINLDLFKKKK